MVPDAASAVPDRALPARLFWIPILLLDGLLLLLLPWTVGVALALAAVAVLGWVVRQPYVSLAVACAGMPLVFPIGAASGDDRATFIALILFVLLPGIPLLWDRLWASRGGPALGPAMRDPVSWLVVALGAWLVCGLAWTRGPLYGAFKTQMYLGVNLLLYAGSAVYLGRNRDNGGVTGTEPHERVMPRLAPRFLQAIFWLQVAIGLSALWNWFSQYYVFRDDRLRTLGMNAIWTARYAGLGIVVAMGLHALGRLRLVLAVPAVALLSWVFLRTGSRGPLVAMALTLGYWALTATRTRRSPGLARALWVGGGLTVFGAIVMVERTASLFAAGRRVSNLVRTRLLEVSVDALSGVTLRGLGTGGFPSLFRLPDDRYYPHNIFLEVLLENGLIGLSLFGAFLAVILTRWRRWRRSLRALPDCPAVREEAALHRTVGAILLFALANAQFSGDIWVNEWIWMGAGMVVAWAPRDKQ